MTFTLPGYKILNLLGKGGMAKVYLAEQQVLERKVALKVMAKSLADDPKFGQRFLSEAKIISKLEHPNIVSIYDMGEQRGSFYISMEFVDGADLKISAQGLTLKQKVNVIVDIAKALKFASEHGVVHRDIKPENIMIRKSNNRAVLMDFGIAKAIETDVRMTQTGVAIGTPHYMSPEQAKGKLVDHRSDIYSLGVVFFFILSGRVPFDGDSAVSIGIKHISNPIPDLPPGYEPFRFVIEKMMAKDADDRYQTAQDVIFDIDDIDIDAIEDDIAVHFYDTSSSDAFNASGLTMLSHELLETRTPLPTAGVSDVSGLFETEDHVFGKRSFFWLWVCLALIGGGIALFYFRPEFAQPWLALAEQYAKKYWGFALPYLKELGIDWISSSA